MPTHDGSSREHNPEIVLRTFLATLKTRDLEVAKLCLTRQSLAGGDPNLPEMPENAPFNYTLAEAQSVEGGILIEAQFDPPIPDTPPTMRFVLLREDDEWKVDLPQTFERTFGVNPEQMMEQMVSQMGDAMKQVGAALAEGIGKAFEGAGAPAGEGGTETADEAPYPADFTQRFGAITGPLDGQLAALAGQLRDHLEVTLEMRVAWRSFLEGANDEEARRVGSAVEAWITGNLWYVLREVNEKVPLANRLNRLRFVHVDSPSKRVIHADGATVVYRLSLRGDGGAYGVDELIQILTGVVAGIPEYSGEDLRISPEPPSAASARDILDDYRNRLEDRLIERLRSVVQGYAHVNVDWDFLRYELGEDPGAMRNLYTWTLNRVVGGFALLLQNETARQLLSRTTASVRLRFVATPEERVLDCSNADLNLALCLGSGEQGCFYEYQIAKALEDGLGVRIKPLAEELTNEFWSWANRLSEMIGRPIDFQWDFPGFTSDPDVNRNLFALTLLREHGFDALGYAISGLFEKNPNFKQQFAARVGMLRVEHAASPAEKRVIANGSAIDYYCHLHEGYDGYLTIQDLQRRLPQLVADMADLPSAGEPAPASGEPQLEEAGPDVAPQAEVPDAAALERERFREIIRSLQPTLKAYPQIFAGMVGKPIQLEIDWESVAPDPNGPGMLLNACLTGLITGLTQLAGEPAMAKAVRDRVDRILLTRVVSPRQARITLDGTTVLVAAMSGPDAVSLEGPGVANCLRQLLQPQVPRAKERQRPAVKKKAPTRPGRGGTKKSPKRR